MPMRPLRCLQACVAKPRTCGRAQAVLSHSSASAKPCQARGRRMQLGAESPLRTQGCGSGPSAPRSGRQIAHRRADGKPLPPVQRGACCRDEISSGEGRAARHERAWSEPSQADGQSGVVWRKVDAKRFLEGARAAACGGHQGRRLLLEPPLQITCRPRQADVAVPQPHNQACCRTIVYV